jgi:hypothetical protein
VRGSAVGEEDDSVVESELLSRRPEVVSPDKVPLDERLTRRQSIPQTGLACGG